MTIIGEERFSPAQKIIAH